MSSPSLAELRRAAGGSATFRLTLRFAGIFVACMLALDLVIGLAAQSIIERRARVEIEEALAALGEADRAGGEEALRARIAALSGEADELSFGYQAPGGALLAGTLALPGPAPSLSVFQPEGIDADEALWVRSVPVPGGGWVSAGASSERYHDVRELMRAGAAWTLAIALPMALLSGGLLSRTVLRRLAPIARTAEGVRLGKLSLRAPLAGTGDEFDRLAAGINAMLETIDSLARNLRNVSVGIAHELRTPLARIRNRLVELSEVRPDLPGDAIDAAMAEIDAALATFDALLRIGQIEANAERKGFDTVRFSELVSELAEVYEPVASGQGKQLSAEVAPGIEIRGDRALLAQMISNLLENAIEHTPEGTAIRVELTDARDGRHLVVADDGPGVPAAEAERIFERFYRLERSRDRAGNGLGLSLVKSICALHGFSVGLKAAATGARFEVAL